MTTLRQVLKNNLTDGQYKFTKNTSYLNEYLDEDVNLVKDIVKEDLQKFLSTHRLFTLKSHPCLCFYKTLQSYKIYNEKNLIPPYTLTGMLFKEWLSLYSWKGLVKNFRDQQLLKSHWDKPFDEVFLLICDKFEHLSKTCPRVDKNPYYGIMLEFKKNNFLPEHLKQLLPATSSIKNSDKKISEPVIKITPTNKTITPRNIYLKRQQLILSAKKRKIKFDLSKEDVEKLLTVKRCYYTGIRFKDSDKHRSRTIDRIDNSKGYEPGNVVACIARVNFIKNLLLEDDQALTLKQTVSFMSKLDKKLQN